MRTDLFFYLTGPMTPKHGRTIEQNTADAAAIYFDLLRRGYPAFCPHLSGLFPSAWAHSLTYEEWLTYDCLVINRCTHVVKLPRWETSTGALAEIAYAERQGIPVIDLTDVERL